MAKTAGRKKRIIVTTAVLATIGGGAAFAYWSSLGTGDGSSATGSSQNFTITSTTTDNTVALSPDGPIHTVNFTVTNPGSGTQHLNAVTPTVANADGTAWNSGTCTAADFTLSGNTFTTPVDVAASGTVTGSVKLQMKNRNVNQDDCKDVTVPVHFAAS